MRSTGSTIDMKQCLMSRRLAQVLMAIALGGLALQLHPLTATDIEVEIDVEIEAEQLAGETPPKEVLDHWAYQRPVRPPVPQANANGSEAFRHRGNPIDAFVAAGHRSQGLMPAAPASASIRLRRVYLDLVGLPPTPDELQAFLADPSANAYRQVVDRLLSRPQYGERWGRHWMDVWRYSDWFGRRHVPDVWNSAPQIWRWRDWIVRSLNSDKGYDRMIVEMLAGDEVAPLDDEVVVATGFLIRNWYALNANDWMRSNVEHTSKAFLGLTLNCAHCHDHRYDPFTQDDYFAMRAFFEPIDIRQDQVPGEEDPGPFQRYDYSTLRKVQRLGLVRIFDRTHDAPTWFYTDGDERNRVQERGSVAPRLPTVFGELPQPIEPVHFRSEVWYPGCRPEIQAAAAEQSRAALEQAEQHRAEVGQRQSTATAADAPLLRLQLSAAEAQVAARQAELSSVEARIAADRAKFPEGRNRQESIVAAARLAARREMSAAIQSATARLRDCEYQLALAESLPLTDDQRAPSIKAAKKQCETARQRVDDSLAQLVQQEPDDQYRPLSPAYPRHSTGRRRALSQWIASSENPLTARVAINHIWLRHFHRPLVDTVFDFGQGGSRPTHPELLDWLAVEFMQSGWSMKHLHRLIVTSNAYQRKSSPDNGEEATLAAQQLDPDNRYLWRMNTGRMEAEVVRDSVLYCAGKLDLQLGGQELENSAALTSYRRSLYYSCHPESDGKSEFGRLFDAPEPRECYRRTRSIVPQQALALSNSPFVHEMSAAIVRRLSADGIDPHRQALQLKPTAFVDAAFRTLLSRGPTASERALCLDFLAATLPAKSSTASTNQAAPTDPRAGLIRVLLNHNDFITIR